MTESRPQQELAHLDPFELWRQFYEANEQAWTKALKDVTSTPGYAESQGKLLDTILAFQKTMRDAMSAQLNALNLPTRDDVARLGELIIGLEEKVDQLDEQVARFEERTGRGGERVAGLEAKVDQVSAGVAGLEAKTGQVDAQLAVLGQRLGGIEQMMGRLDERLAGLDQRLALPTEEAVAVVPVLDGDEVPAPRSRRARVGRVRPAADPAMVPNGDAPAEIAE